MNEKFHRLLKRDRRQEKRIMNTKGKRNLWHTHTKGVKTQQSREKKMINYVLLQDHYFSMLV